MDCKNGRHGRHRRDQTAMRTVEPADVGDDKIISIRGHERLVEGKSGEIVLVLGILDGRDLVRANSFADQAFFGLVHHDHDLRCRRQPALFHETPTARMLDQPAAGAELSFAAQHLHHPRIVLVQIGNHRQSPFSSDRQDAADHRQIVDMERAHALRRNHPVEKALPLPIPKEGMSDPAIQPSRQGGKPGNPEDLDAGPFAGQRLFAFLRTDYDDPMSRRHQSARLFLYTNVGREAGFQDHANRLRHHLTSACCFGPASDLTRA